MLRFWTVICEITNPLSEIIFLVLFCFCLINIFSVCTNNTKIPFMWKTYLAPNLFLMLFCFISRWFLKHGNKWNSVAAALSVFCLFYKKSVLQSADWAVSTDVFLQYIPANPLPAGGAEPRGRPEGWEEGEGREEEGVTVVVDGGGGWASRGNAPARSTVQLNFLPWPHRILLRRSEQWPLWLLNVWARASLGLASSPPSARGHQHHLQSIHAHTSLTVQQVLSRAKVKGHLCVYMHFSNLIILSESCSTARIIITWFMTQTRWTEFYKLFWSFIKIKIFGISPETTFLGVETFQTILDALMRNVFSRWPFLKYQKLESIFMLKLKRRNQLSSVFSELCHVVMSLSEAK